MDLTPAATSIPRPPRSHWKVQNGHRRTVKNVAACRDFVPDRERSWTGVARLSITRNEGVPGSNPGVGSEENPLEMVRFFMPARRFRSPPGPRGNAGGNRWDRGRCHRGRKSTGARASFRAMPNRPRCPLVALSFRAHFPDFAGRLDGVRWPVRAASRVPAFTVTRRTTTCSELVRGRQLTPCPPGTVPAAARFDAPEASAIRSHRAL